MAERLNISSESPEDGEGDSKSKSERSSSRKGRSIRVPLSVRREVETEAKPEHEAPKQQPKTLAELIAGRPESAGETSKAEEQGAVENTTEVPPNVEERAEDASVDEVLTEAVERSVAEDLYSGEEISLREISQIPPERDEDVIDEALEIAAIADTEVQATLPEEAETNAEAEAEKLPAITNSAEAEPATVEDKTPEAVPPTPPHVVVPPPRLPRNRFRSNPYNNPPGGGGPTGFGLPPMPPGNGGNYSPGRNLNAAPLDTNSKKIIENAEWESFQEGRRKGLVAGLLVGGGIEHFRHKRREKKMEKRQKKETLAQQKRVERLEHDYVVAKQSQKSEQARSETNLARERLATTAERTERAKEIEELKKTQERLVKQTSEIRPSEEELLAAVPKGHRIESSAWHNIEVDEHGRAVQESAIEYGHEYYKERVHEVAPKQQVDSAAGEVALVAAALSEAGGHSTVPAPAVQAQASSIVDTTQQPQAHSLRGGVQTVLKTVTTPPSTPFATVVWLAVLVVIAIVVFTIAR